MFLSNELNFGFDYWNSIDILSKDSLQNLVETPNIHAIERVKNAWDDGLNSASRTYRQFEINGWNWSTSQIKYKFIYISIPLSWVLRGEPRTSPIQLALKDFST